MTAPAVSEFPVKRTNTTTMILRRDVQASLFDGAIMHGYQYGQQLLETDQPHPEDAIPVPLLCLATELGNSREYHGLVLKLASQPNSPKHIYTVDMRGRGRSFESPVSGTDVHTDADDLINFCDANSLHHIDVLVSGHSAFVIFLAARKRPGLVRKLILNDGAPELDTLGTARHTTLLKRIVQPDSWASAAHQMRDLKAGQFPGFDDKDWLIMAQHAWRNDNGTPVTDIAKGLTRLSNLVDFDTRQPAMWKELKLFDNHGMLLINGEFSTLVTQPIVEDLQARHPHAQLIVAEGQGHVPLLNRGNLPQKIFQFLAAAEE